MVETRFGECPHCRLPVTSGQVSPYCEGCGRELPGKLVDLINAEARFNEHEQARVAAQLGPSVNDTTMASPILARYRDAYRVAAALVGMGDVIKIIGAALAVLIAVGSLSSAGDFFGAAVVLSGFFMAAVIGILFWVAGVIVSAQGQVLRATLDNTVGHSPYMCSSERLKAMGLPDSLAERVIG